MHNLRATDRGTPDGPAASRPWAQSFDDAVKAALAGRDDRALIGYERLAGASTAVATPDHYFPFLYALGAAGAGGRAREDGLRGLPVGHARHALRAVRLSYCSSPHEKPSRAIIALDALGPQVPAA